ncbi:MAG TPA: hypothetical protein VGM80_16795 [Gaiellaceae bacterium]|jgi:hypothetical protein
MDGPKRRRRFGQPGSFRKKGPLRSFALGGLVGAAGTIATVRRLRRTSARMGVAGGLAAFEDAPCFREIVEREGHGTADPAPKKRPDTE